VDLTSSGHLPRLQTCSVRVSVDPDTMALVRDVFNIYEAADPQEQQRILHSRCAATAWKQLPSVSALYAFGQALRWHRFSDNVTWLS
jgi:hypothetical protein